MADIAEFLSRCKTRLLYLVEEVSVLYYAYFLVVIIVVFAALYSFLTPFGHGIGRNLIPLPEATFYNGVYLSLVTISSLGYSDIHPMGASKAIACIEVLLGVALTGILIARLASRRLSYHVSRLYSDHAQNRLDEIATHFNGIRDEMNRIIRVHSDVFQEIPGESNHRNRRPLISDFQQVVERLKSTCTSFYEYLKREVDQTDYFQNVRTSAIIRAGRSIDRTFFLFNQFLLSLSPLIKPEVLSTDERANISKSIATQAKVNEIVEHYSTDLATRETFETVKQTCDNLLRSFAEVPTESLPDQVSWGTDDPQSFLEEDGEPTSRQE